MVTIAKTIAGMIMIVSGIDGTVAGHVSLPSVIKIRFRFHSNLVTVIVIHIVMMTLVGTMMMMIGIVRVRK